LASALAPVKKASAAKKPIEWYFEDQQVWNGTTQQYTTTDLWVEASNSKDLEILYQDYLQGIGNDYVTLNIAAAGAVYVYNFSLFLQVRQTYSPASNSTGYIRRIKRVDPNVNPPVEVVKSAPTKAVHQPTSSSSSASAPAAAAPAAAASAAAAPAAASSSSRKASRKHKKQHSSSNSSSSLDKDEADRSKLPVNDRFPLIPLVTTFLSPNAMSSWVVDLSNLGEAFPSYWPNHHDPDPGVMTCDIPLDSVVGKTILGYFASTLGTRASSYAWPVKIVANTNKKMYKHFLFQNKCFIEDDGGANPVWGWHGPGHLHSKDSNQKNIDSILSLGYDRSFSRAQLWGVGTYFSGKTDYSFWGYCGSYNISSSGVSGFKTKRHLQEKTIILNMLLLGNTERATMYSGSYNSTMHIGYNSRSVPDDGAGNQFYILGQGTDKQAFPAFVLYFEHYKNYETSMPPW
jgi:hypothetical protein